MKQYNILNKEVIILKILEVEVKENLYQEFKDIIEDKNFSLNGIIEVVMINTIAEKGIDWLVETLRNEIATKNEKKKRAVKLFREKGFAITQYNMNFASRNKGNNQYWINSNKNVILSDWHIILNDDIKKKIYLLYIPKNTISSLKNKNDKQYNISLLYGDLIDIHTGIDFSRFLIDEIEYDSLML